MNRDPQAWPRDPQAWARLGRALREARERGRVTQQALADAAGVSIPAIRDAEQGRVPKARMPYSLAKIAAALDWPAGTVEAVLDGEDPPGGWRQASARVPSGVVEDIVTKAIVRATDSATAAEIRAAVTIALEEFTKEGLLVEDGPVSQEG